MRSIEVRVVNSDGRPAQGEKVSVWVYQFAASGAVEPKYTNSDGVAEFDLDIDDSAEISISVDGYEKIGRGSVRGSYRVQL